jgi:hypothetical protein
VGYRRHLKMRNAFKMLSENLKGRDHLEDLGVDGRISERSLNRIGGFELYLGG